MIEGGQLNPAAHRSRPRREWIIQPRRPGLLNLLRDVWRYRSLWTFIGTRSVLQIYRRAILGMAWLVIRPAVTVVTSIFVVGRILGISTEPVPLLLFTLISVALWTLFSGGIRHGTKSLTRGRGITRRLNFPRIMLVLGALAPASIEFAVVFAGALIVFGYFAVTGAFVPMPSLRLLAIVPVLLLVMMLVLAVACVTSVLNTIASDTALSVNYATTGLLLATPVVYPVAAVPNGLAMGCASESLGTRHGDLALGFARHPASPLVVRDHCDYDCDHHADRGAELFPALGADRSREELMIVAPRRVRRPATHLRRHPMGSGATLERMVDASSSPRSLRPMTAALERRTPSSTRSPKSGADAVKFQTHFADAESSPLEPFRVKFSRQDETRYDYWKRLEFTEEQWDGLARHAEERSLVFLSSPFSLKAVDLLGPPRDASLEGRIG